MKKLIPFLLLLILLFPSNAEAAKIVFVRVKGRFDENGVWVPGYRKQVTFGNKKKVITPTPKTTDKTSELEKQVAELKTETERLKQEQQNLKEQQDTSEKIFNEYSTKIELIHQQIDVIEADYLSKDRQIQLSNKDVNIISQERIALYQQTYGLIDEQIQLRTSILNEYYSTPGRKTIFLRRHESINYPRVNWTETLDRPIIIDMATYGVFCTLSACYYVGNINFWEGQPITENKYVTIKLPKPLQFEGNSNLNINQIRFIKTQ